MVNAEEPTLKVMPATELPAVKLLFKVDPAVPAEANTHESPEAGGLLVLMTFQLEAVPRFASVSPVQVSGPDKAKTDTGIEEINKSIAITKNIFFIGLFLSIYTTYIK